VEGLAVNQRSTHARVFLTGGAGFIGSHLARLLVREGHEVTAIIRPGADRWRLADIASRLDIIDADLTELATLKPRLRASRPDVCIHLAWKGWSGKAEADANLTSLGISLELLRSMPDLGCPRFVAAGTCFEYRLTSNRLAETTPLAPHDLYGACKKSLFEVAQEFSALTGVSVVTPRIFYSYGPYEDARRLVPSITQSLLRGEVARVTPGEQVRDYLHVEDVARAIWTVANSNATGAVNIASGEAGTIADIARRLGQIVGRPELVRIGELPYRDGEPMHILSDATKLRRELGFEPRYDLDRGLHQTIEWWRTQVTVV
jgi:nucleoside-diphosphate-sugar epimerase